MSIHRGLFLSPANVIMSAFASIAKSIPRYLSMSLFLAPSECFQDSTRSEQRNLIKFVTLHDVNTQSLLGNDLTKDERTIAVHNFHSQAVLNRLQAATVRLHQRLAVVVASFLFCAQAFQFHACTGFNPRRPRLMMTTTTATAAMKLLLWCGFRARAGGRRDRQLAE